MQCRYFFGHRKAGYSWGALCLCEELTCPIDGCFLSLGGGHRSCSLPDWLHSPRVSDVCPVFPSAPVPSIVKFIQAKLHLNQHDRSPSLF